MERTEQQWPNPAAFTNLADYVRASAAFALAQASEGAFDSHKPTSEDRALIKALNRFLAVYHLPPFTAKDVRVVPNDFARLLAMQYELPRLNQGPNFFNSGAEAQARIASAKHALGFAALLDAIGAALGAEDAPYYSKADAAAPSTISAEDKQHALWWRKPIPKREGWSSSCARVESLDLSVPSVLVIGGALTLTHDHVQIDRLSRAVESLLGGTAIYTPEAKTNPRIYVFSHPTRHRPLIQADSLRFNASGDTVFTQDYVKAFFQQSIKPALDSAQQHGTLVQALSNLTIVATSVGGMTARMLESCLREELMRHGYAKTEIEHLMAHVCVLTAGSVAKLSPRPDQPACQTLHLVSAHDHTARSRAYHDQWIPADIEPPALVSLDAHQQLYWVEAPEAGYILPSTRIQTPTAPVSIEKTLYPPHGDRTGHSPKLLFESSVARAMRRDEAQRREAAGDALGAHYSADAVENFLRHAVIRPAEPLTNAVLAENLNRRIELVKPAHPHRIWRHQILSQQETRALPEPANLA